MGFNSVRFYINYCFFEDDAAPYKYKESGFKWLDKNVKWAKKYGMGIIINMHCPQGGYQSAGNGMELWNDAENQNRLIALWKAIAERYSGEPAVWGYGLLNEPYVPLLDTSYSLHLLFQLSTVDSNTQNALRNNSFSYTVEAEGISETSGSYTGSKYSFSIDC